MSHGIKPIIGCEIYVAPTSRFEKKGVDKGPKEYNNHLILLAMNKEGYRNLCKLVSLGYMEGFYYKPRIDKELLRELNGGLIALSACLQGEVCQALSAGNVEKAKGAAETYASIFTDRYYIEIQDNKLAEQEKLNPLLVELAKDLSIPVVATTASAMIFTPTMCCSASRPEKRSMKITASRWKPTSCTLNRRRR